VKELEIMSWLFGNKDKGLYNATQNGNLEAVKKYIGKGANVNYKHDWLERSPLHIAIIWGYQDIVTQLIDSGADVNIQDKDQATPLHEAALRDRVEIAKILLQKGAKVDPISRGQTPLHMACAEGRTEVVRLLIENKADINALYNQSTPLHIASEGGFESIVNLLIASGANVNAKNASEGTALHVASIKGFERVASVLLEHSAAVNIKNKLGETPIDSGRRKKNNRKTVYVAEMIEKYSVPKSSNSDEIHSVSAATFPTAKNDGTT